MGKVVPTVPKNEKTRVTAEYFLGTTLVPTRPHFFPSEANYAEIRRGWCKSMI